MTTTTTTTNTLISTIQTLTDNILSTTTNDVVVIDTKESRIGVKINNPEYAIHVGGSEETIKCPKLIVDNINCTNGNGTITCNNLNVYTLDVSNITISDTTSITNDHFVSILTPGKNDAGNEGTGGLVVTAGAAFSAGTTIYGRWDSLQLNTDTSAAIVYFGY